MFLLRGYSLVVLFEIEETKGGNTLNCKIRYEKEFEYKFYASASTPETALLFFAKDILKEVGESGAGDVAAQYTERVSYELMSRV